MAVADMIITIEAAAPVGTSRVTINAGSKVGAASVCPTCAAASSCRAGSSSPDSLANPGSYQR